MSAANFPQGNSSRNGETQRDQPEPQNLRELWLDLEDTVITPAVDGWWKTECINIEKVRGFIDKFKPDRVNIFSFAIWNINELEKFNDGTREMLETALGVKLEIVWSVDNNMIPMCAKEMGLSAHTIDFQEMSNFWSKQGAFRLCIRQRAKALRNHNIHLTAALLDDVVFDELITWPDLDTKIIIINIDELTI